jgi:ADP-ribose pyrophosphatase YjhB (NUDIX family)
MDEALPRERPTARVLLFDPDHRVLLMRGRMPHQPEGFGAWFTVGGGIEPGESLAEAARREVAEETGFTEVEIGPVVWFREGTGRLASGERVLFKESYIVARCAGGEPHRGGWEAHEHRLMDDMRWWTRDALAASAEPIYPEGLADLLVDLIAGRFPHTPLVLAAYRA